MPRDTGEEASNQGSVTVLCVNYSWYWQFRPGLQLLHHWGQRTGNFYRSWYWSPCLNIVFPPNSLLSNVQIPIDPERVPSFDPVYNYNSIERASSTRMHFELCHRYFAAGDKWLRYNLSRLVLASFAFLSCSQAVQHDACRVLHWPVGMQLCVCGAIWAELCLVMTTECQCDQPEPISSLIISLQWLMTLFIWLTRLANS